MSGLRVTACALAALTLAACGSDGTQKRHDAVNAYLRDVSAAQVDLSGRIARIDAALAGFSLRNATPKEERALRAGRASVQRAIEKVRAVKPPPDARRIHALVLQRLTVQRDLLDELVVTAADARRLSASVPELQAASARLRQDFATIGAQTVPAGGSAELLGRYGAAFGRYGDALRPIAPRVVPSAKPSLLRPLLKTEHDGLERSALLTDRIQAALERHDIPAANRAVHSLLTIAASLNGVGTQKAEAAAARAYNARIRRITTLETAISKEHARLVRVVG